MSRQPYMQIVLGGEAMRNTGLTGGVAMRSLGYKAPSPLVGIQLDDIVCGDSGNGQGSFSATFNFPGSLENKVHVSSFEMMLYEFAQMRGNAETDCYIEIGWCKEGVIIESLKMQAMFVQFKATVHTGYMEYVCSGFCNFSCMAALQSIAIPAIRGYYQPSVVLEAILNYVKAYEIFDYDIDHDDEVVPIDIEADRTSLNKIIFGEGDKPGLIQQTYNAGSKSSAYKLPGNFTTDELRTAGYTNTEIKAFMGEPVCTTQRSASSYTLNIVEPTFYSKGIIRYKNDVNLVNYVSDDSLIWGGLHTNILSITATYNGVTANILGGGKSVSTGIAMSLSGETATSTANRQVSYAATVNSMFSAGTALNNLNALSTQFNTDIRVTVVGAPKIFKMACTFKLIVYTGGTLNPITGTYKMMKISHKVTGTSYTTELTLKRLDPVSANSTVASIAGYTNPITTNQGKSAATPSNKLYLGPAFQSLSNLMKRGEL